MHLLPLVVFGEAEGEAGVLAGAQRVAVRVQLSDGRLHQLPQPAPADCVPARQVGALRQLMPDLLHAVPHLLCEIPAAAACVRIHGRQMSLAIPRSTHTTIHHLFQLRHLLHTPDLAGHVEQPRVDEHVGRDPVFLHECHRSIHLIRQLAEVLPPNGENERVVCEFVGPQAVCAHALHGCLHFLDLARAAESVDHHVVGHQVRPQTSRLHLLQSLLRAVPLAMLSENIDKRSVRDDVRLHSRLLHVLQHPLRCLPL
mmetsp:Transcript_22590/g.37764  ORF Transcript_22590/g.37764 Transcript_22590/m.37764 type:complete len:256 (+) Transcript_22590:891-1658(+)